jgi:prepilin-type N-terminal cleavage/methylation domain-containing protein
MRRLRSQQGFAMTELLIAITISLVVFGAAVTAFSGFLGTSKRTDRQSEAQDTARRSIDRIAHQLRSATATGATAAQPVEQSSSYDLVYLAPYAGASLTNNPRGLQHVRYCLKATTLSNEELWYQTAPYDSATQPSPPATSSCPSSSWPNQQRVAQYLVNQYVSPVKPLFSTTADPQGNITNVTVQAVVDVEPTKSPAPTELKSGVALRNANHAPTATVTCRAQNGHAICDASASYDRDGQSTTFQWKYTPGGSGTWIPNQTAYSFDQAGLSSGTTYAITVRVTDSLGAYTDASYNLAMP